MVSKFLGDSRWKKEERGKRENGGKAETRPWEILSEKLAKLEEKVRERERKREKTGTRTRPLTLPALHKWPRSPWLRSCNFYWTIAWSNNERANAMKWSFDSRQLLTISTLIIPSEGFQSSREKSRERLEFIRVAWFARRNQVELRLHGTSQSVNRGNSLVIFLHRSVRSSTERERERKRESTSSLKSCCKISSVLSILI